MPLLDHVPALVFSPLHQCAICCSPRPRHRTSHAALAQAILNSLTPHKLRNCRKRGACCTFALCNLFCTASLRSPCRTLYAPCHVTRTAGRALPATCPAAHDARQYVHCATRPTYVARTGCTAIRRPTARRMPSWLPAIRPIAPPLAPLHAVHLRLAATHAFPPLHVARAAGCTCKSVGTARLVPTPYVCTAYTVRLRPAAMHPPRIARAPSPAIRVCNHADDARTAAARTDHRTRAPPLRTRSLADATAHAHAHLTARLAWRCYPPLHIVRVPRRCARMHLQGTYARRGSRCAATRATHRTLRRTPNASAPPLHMSHMCDTCTAHGTRDARRLATTAFPAVRRKRAPRRRRTYAAHRSPSHTSYACPAARPAAAVYCTRTHRIRLPPCMLACTCMPRRARIASRSRSSFALSGL
ncbi:hypothetical protein GGX14DRAFT_565376 [Mycena pura]|uniref:Uncharacterized protein n=1 Tax=Mycena pura TaxID=153505 RepID=A0AAD6YFM6_9AGAR|nr:hypothetical protein GGX14DRAFT_565376 [Mycena pura]